jgi:hypothetical protein
MRKEHPMDERIIETIDVGTDEQFMLSIDANGRLYVGDEPAPAISALGGGIVALTTARRTVHIDAADYWRLLHGDVPPSLRDAGYLAAQLALVRKRACELIELLDEEELLDNAYYPSIEEVAAALRTALGEQISEQLVAA